MVKVHPELTEPSAIASLLSQFGPSDTDLIVVSLKGSKKASAGTEDKKPKYGTALVPFKQIGDAFAAVCASGKPERGLNGIEVSWVGGKEPQILGWLKKMGKLGEPPGSSRLQDGDISAASDRKATLEQAPQSTRGSASSPAFVSRSRAPARVFSDANFQSLRQMLCPPPTYLV
jgi:DnaJ family protein C protein 17